MQTETSYQNFFGGQIGNFNVSCQLDDIIELMFIFFLDNSIVLTQENVFSGTGMLKYWGRWSVMTATTYL